MPVPPAPQIKNAWKISEATGLRPSLLFEDFVVILYCIATVAAWPDLLHKQGPNDDKGQGINNSIAY